MEAGDPDSGGLPNRWRNVGALQIFADYVLSHTALQRILRHMGYSPDVRDQELCGYLDWLNDQLQFHHWYFGHFHEDRAVVDRYTCLNHWMIALGETIADPPKS